MSDVGELMSSLSEWIDTSPNYIGADPEAVTWRRVGKIGEEFGEVIAALIGALGENPRKGVTHTVRDVIDELLDVAVTALGAVEHLTGNRGESWDLLAVKIEHVVLRAALTTKSRHE